MAHIMPNADDHWFQLRSCQRCIPLSQRTGPGTLWVAGGGEGTLRIKGEPILEKETRGIARASDTPLSFWGGFNPDTGSIIDQRHPLAGQNATGQVLVIPAGRGSCSGSGVILEAIVNHTAPSAILISQIDPIIALGCILGAELHDDHPALLVISDHDRHLIRTGDEITITKSGWISIHRV